MKKLIIFILQLLLLAEVMAQDTFSIVAVDSVTGEVGSAGATCLEAPNTPNGALIISDMIPGKGAIHTQALWNQYNQENARYYLTAGYTAKDILHYVNLDDWDGDSTIRQYGVAMFDSLGRVQAAAYTGVNCFDYKNHNLGAYYSIQGNILLGQQILDAMEANFLSTNGTLAERLMACLQGANVPGADSRCLSEGVPSQSAFIRVARPADADSTLFLHLIVKSRPYGMSPIDSLQTLFDEWRANHLSITDRLSEDVMKVYPNPSNAVSYLQFANEKNKIVEIFDAVGRKVSAFEATKSHRLLTSNWNPGVYIVRSESSVQKLIVQ